MDMMSPPVAVVASAEEIRALYAASATRARFDQMRGDMPARHLDRLRDQLRAALASGLEQSIELSLDSYGIATAYEAITAELRYGAEPDLYGPLRTLTRSLRAASGMEPPYGVIDSFQL